MSPKQYFDLSHFGLVQISGEDAATFLQNQITADINDLKLKPWLMAAWCNPKGRILSNFILFQSEINEESSFFIMLPSMLKEQIMKRLKMFVLRSKVNIEDAGENHTLLGLYGDNIDTVINEAPVLYEIAFTEDIKRNILVLDNEQLNTLMPAIKLACEESDRRHWSLLDIEGAIPWVISQTTEKFIPQMLNMDLNGGVSFKKGCFPGQEVVARLHYKGNEGKRRLHWIEGETETIPGPGDTLVNANDKLIGEIVDAEPAKTSSFKALAIIDIEEAKQSVLLREQKNVLISSKEIQSIN